MLRCGRISRLGCGCQKELRENDRWNRTDDGSVIFAKDHCAGRAKLERMVCVRHRREMLLLCPDRTLSLRIRFLLGRELTTLVVEVGLKFGRGKMTHGTDQCIGTGEQIDQDLSRQHSHNEKILQISETSNRSRQTVKGTFRNHCFLKNKKIDKEQFVVETTDALRKLKNNTDRKSANELIHKVALLSEEVQSPLHRFELALHPFDSFLVMPVFAIANAGVKVEGNVFDTLL